MTHVSSTQEVPAHGDTPRHVAIIMDGNGRWAKRRFLPRVAGHRRGRRGGARDGRRLRRARRRVPDAVRIQLARTGAGRRRKWRS